MVLERIIFFKILHKIVTGAFEYLYLNGNGNASKTAVFDRHFIDI